MAPSIRNVKSLTRNAYESRQTIADWNQQVIQQTAKKGKRHYEKEEKPGEKEKMGGRESVKISPPAPLLAAVYYKTVQ